MADKTIKTRIQMKNDSQENWDKASGFIPKAGEFVVYNADDNNSVPRVKVGDGESAVTALPFLNDAISDEIYVGPGDMPEGCTLQIDIDGDVPVLPDLPVPTVDDAGLVIKVQEDGTYGLGEGGISEVSADVVTTGTFAGEVKANSSAVSNLNVAQMRNIVIGTEEPTDEIIASLNIGDLYFVKEA